MPVFSVPDLRSGAPADPAALMDLLHGAVMDGDIRIALEGSAAGEVFVVPEGLPSFAPAQQVAVVRIHDHSTINLLVSGVVPVRRSRPHADAALDSRPKSAADSVAGPEHSEHSPGATIHPNGSRRPIPKFPGRHQSPSTDRTAPRGRVHGRIGDGLCTLTRPTSKRRRTWLRRRPSLSPRRTSNGPRPAATADRGAPRSWPTPAPTSSWPPKAFGICCLRTATPSTPARTGGIP